jgi:putative transposase
MTRFLQPLWLLLTGSTDSHLREVVEYLREENRILRSKLPKQVTVTARERGRLLKLGRKLGGAIRQFVTIVSYRTFCRWRADPVRIKRGPFQRKPGRPRTAEETRELIINLARDNGWGSTRVLGELKKLGLHKVGRTTVASILREAGLDPGPKRGEGSWAEFVKRHAATLWAADFISVRTLTMTGFVDLYLLFFIHVGSRRVIVSTPTGNPDAVWVAQQARNASMQMQEWGLEPSRVIIDGDRKFQEGFFRVFESEGAVVQRVGPRSPNMNAFAERWVQTLRKECLDHFLVVGERHLGHIVCEFVEHYNEERPHQARGNVPLPVAQAEDAGPPPILQFPSGEVGCRERLGGLLRHYYRAAA